MGVSGWTANSRKDLNGCYELGFFIPLLLFLFLLVNESLDLVSLPRVFSESLPPFPTGQDIGNAKRRKF